jgi:hypothetical protein
MRGRGVFFLTFFLWKRGWELRPLNRGDMHIKLIQISFNKGLARTNIKNLKPPLNTYKPDNGWTICHQGLMPQKYIDIISSHHCHVPCAGLKLSMLSVLIDKDKHIRLISEWLCFWSFHLLSFTCVQAANMWVPLDTVSVFLYVSHGLFKQRTLA